MCKIQASVTDVHGKLKETILTDFGVIVKGEWIGSEVKCHVYLFLIAVKGAWFQFWGYNDLKIRGIFTWLGEEHLFS